MRGALRLLLDERNQPKRVFHGIRGIVTEKLVEYMCFKAHYQNVGPKEDVPVQEMQERIPPEIVLEVWVVLFGFNELGSLDATDCWLQITKRVSHPQLYGQLSLN